MKKIIVCLGLAAAVTGTGCREESAAQPGTPSGALLRLQSAGWNAVAAGDQAVVLRDIGRLATSKEVFKILLDKLAGTPARVWADHLPSDAASRNHLIQPLVRDLCTAPAFARIDGSTARPAVLAAVRVDAARAALWSTNLWQLVEAWKLGRPVAVNDAGDPAWQTSLPDDQGVLGIRYLKGWMVFLAGVNTEPLLKKTLAGLPPDSGKGTLPPGELARVEVDWPRLSAWVAWAGKIPVLPMTLTLSGDGEYVRTQAKFLGGSPLRIEYGPWDIPTNFISEPIVSFTAARGVRPILSRLDFIRELKMDPVPNQLVEWGQRFLNGQTMIAFPAREADRQMSVIATNLPRAITSRMNDQMSGNIFWKSNQFELAWGGLPVIMPFAKSVRTNDQEYLMAGLFPYVVKTNPPPAELFDQVFKSEDILYYDWEITEQRLLHNRHYYQMIDIFANRVTVKSDSAVFRWMSDAHTRLGNSVTEARWTAPDRIEVSRKSHLGFTGYEIVTLMRWLQTDGFPLSFEPQPPIVIPDRLKSLQSPAAAPPGGDR